MSFIELTLLLYSIMAQYVCLSSIALPQYVCLSSITLSLKMIVFSTLQFVRNTIVLFWVTNNLLKRRLSLKRVKFKSQPLMLSSNKPNTSELLHCSILKPKGKKNYREYHDQTAPDGMKIIPVSKSFITLIAGPLNTNQISYLKKTFLLIGLSQQLLTKIAY